MTLTSPRDEGSLGTTGLVANKMSAFVRTQARNSGPWILRKTSRVGLPFTYCFIEAHFAIPATETQ